MTEREFFQELGRTRHRGWRICPFGLIRDRYGCCPLVAVCRRYGEPYIGAESGAEAGDHIGLRESVALRIERSADLPNARHYNTRRTRAKIVKAVGLTE